MAVSEVESPDDLDIDPAIAQYIDRKVEERVAEETAELREENQQLRNQVAELNEQIEGQPEAEFRGNDSDLRNLWIGSHPLGTIIQNAKQRSTENDTRLDEIEEHGVESEGAATVDRSKLLPIHKMWIDIKNGDEENVSTNSYRRGARLFARFIRKASGEKSVGVDATYGTYSLEQSEGRDILEDAGDMTNGGKTKTAERAMKSVQKGTKVEDCDCKNIEECDHGLIVYDTSEGTNNLVTDKYRFNAAMRNVQAAIEGELNHGSSAGDEASSGTADADSTATTETSEEDEVMAELDTIRNASPDADSDTVVRSSDGLASDGGETPSQ